MRDIDARNLGACRYCNALFFHRLGCPIIDLFAKKGVDASGNGTGDKNEKL